MFIAYGIIGYIVTFTNRNIDLGLLPAIYGMAGALGIVMLALLENVGNTSLNTQELKDEIKHLESKIGELESENNL